MKVYYIDEYILGWELVEREKPSELRWPVSHGPFRTEDDAIVWAIKNITK